MGNYIYNGASRPPIAEWNGETHPYVYIVSHAFGNYMYRAKNIQYGTDEYGYQLGMVDGWPYSFTSGKSTDWEKIRQKEQTGLNSNLDDIVWANFDVLNEDGSIYLPASYPIDAETGEEITIYGLNPVPVPQLNPAALMQGFATMLSLRRNRT